MTRKLLWIALLFAVSGCAGGSAQIDLEAEREAIRRADLDFCEALTSGDAERFMSLIAADGTFYGETVSHGPEEVLEQWAPLFGPDAAIRLTWEPDTVRVSVSGDLGYSMGRYEMRSGEPAGEPRVGYGRYVTIWTKGPDGSWQAAVDIGTPPGEQAD